MLVKFKLNGDPVEVNLKSGDRLLVVNTPDNRLTVFDVTGALPERQNEIFVGLEPISVRCADDTTAWVVNFLSDDVSIVDLNTMNVKATLRVGDEPGDVVFAGTPTRAYVSVGGEDAVDPLLEQDDLWLRAATVWEIGIRGLREFRANIEGLLHSEHALLREAAEIVIRRI